VDNMGFLSNFVLFALGVEASLLHAQNLPPLNIAPGGITVSGFSAGGYFAPQFHVAFSSIISGAAVWSGGPNLCLADPNCTFDDYLMDMNYLVSETRRMADNGDIDPLENLVNQKVYIYHGFNDGVVNQDSGYKTYEYYELLQAQMGGNFDLPSSHAVVSDFYGTSCGFSDFYIYIENCGFDSVYAALNHLYGGGLVFPVSGFDSSNLLSFSQVMRTKWSLNLTFDSGPIFRRRVSL